MEQGASNRSACDAAREGQPNAGQRVLAWLIVHSWAVRHLDIKFITGSRHLKEVQWPILSPYSTKLDIRPILYPIGAKGRQIAEMIARGNSYQLQEFLAIPIKILFPLIAGPAVAYFTFQSVYNGAETSVPPDTVEFFGLLIGIPLAAVLGVAGAFIAGTVLASLVLKVIEVVSYQY